MVQSLDLASDFFILLREKKREENVRMYRNAPD